MTPDDPKAGGCQPSEAFRLLATRLCAQILVMSEIEADPRLSLMDYQFTHDGVTLSPMDLARRAVQCEQRANPTGLSDEAVAAVILGRLTDSFKTVEGEA